MARGRKAKSYKTIPVTFRLHEKVSDQVDDLRGNLDRSAFITMLIAEKAGKDLHELLVPNRETNQEQLGRTA
ncbi:hypothetical protein [Nocardia asteroides]|uniref:hypothetical protein n=1 Tax=Nocardia asteroides TaxID=1824 RepID=UPI001E656A05|nr:hypothetical protein [Nocardia asteroides]UGT58910.1 hypothetical protein LTT85_33015 [Nocardia asteroides]